MQGLNRLSAQVIRKLALDITANLKRASSEGGTPVDTGWARANWHTSVAVPAMATVGSRQNVPRGDLGRAALLTYHSPAQGNVYISNVVPYITRLNEGSSKKAPAGFVQLAIAAAVRMSGGRVL